MINKVYTKTEEEKYLDKLIEGADREAFIEAVIRLMASMPADGYKVGKACFLIPNYYTKIHTDLRVAAEKMATIYREFGIAVITPCILEPRVGGYSEYAEKTEESITEEDVILELFPELTGTSEVDYVDDRLRYKVGE